MAKKKTNDNSWIPAKIPMKMPEGGFISSNNKDKKSYNPNLANKDENFQNWYKSNTLEGKHNIPYSEKLDYDYYSYFRNGDYKSYTGGHFPDTYKRPNEPTFSNESIYSTPENPGGSWNGENFIPYKKNMKKGEKLQKYPEGGELKPLPKQGITNQNRTDWNTYVDWLDKQGKKGKQELDTNQLGFQLLDQYDKQFPNTTINKDSIPLIQGDFANYKTFALNQIKQGKAAYGPGVNENNFMSSLSKVDGYPGQRTTSFKFPQGYLQSYEDGQYQGTQNTGWATTNKPLKEGGTIPMAKSGIHIKPENKGKFNATKKATGKSTEELTHSKNPVTKKRAIFAQNAAKWHHGEDGLNLQDPGDPITEGSFQNALQYLMNQESDNPWDRISHLPTNLPISRNTPAQKITLKDLQPDTPQLINPNSGGPKTPKGNKVNYGDIALGALSGIDAILPYGNTNRKYIRPEDQLSYNANSYGTGSNALMKEGGTIPDFTQYISMEEAAKREQEALPSFAMGASIPGMSGSMYGIVPQTNIQKGERKNIFPYRMANGGDISPEKAQEILSDGKIYGKPITDKQRKYFGSIISDAPKAADGLQLYSPDSEIKHLSPSTIEFQGASHEQSNDVGTKGIPMSFNGKQAEVEHGEPASINKDGSLTIFGGLKNPLTNNLFKTDAKRLADKEARTQKFIDKGTTLVNNNDPQDKFGMLAFNSGRAMMEGGVAKQKQLTEMKEHLSDLQNAMLQIAPTSADQKKAKRGMNIPKYASGGTQEDPIDPGTPDVPGFGPDGVLTALKEAIGNHESGNNYQIGNLGGSSAYGKYQFTKATRLGYYNQNKDHFNKAFGVSNANDFESAYKANKGNIQEDLMNINLTKLSNEFGGDTKAVALAHAFGEKGAKDLLKQGYTYIGKQKVGWDTPVQGSGNNGNWTPNSYLKGLKLDESTPIDNSQSITPLQSPKVESYNPSFKPGAEAIAKGIMSNFSDPSPKPSNQNYFNFREPLPQSKSSNAEPLGFTQILPEIYSAATNQEVPVKMQKYSPDLYSPYKVSFQDQINSNNAELKGIEKQVAYNPTALSTLAGQNYEANDKVKAEEFRQNQAIASDITNKNTALLNEAKSTNLKLGDEQYVRQAEAKSNTKAQNYEMLQSISNKVTENKLAQKKLQLYENLYPSWSFDPNTGRPIHQGNDEQYVNLNPTVGSVPSSGERDITGNDGTIYTEHDDGKGHKSYTIKQIAPVQQKKAELDVLKKQQGINNAADVGTQKYGGKMKNGGIIKKYKLSIK